MTPLPKIPGLRFEIVECPDCDGRGHHVRDGKRGTCGVCLGDRYVFVDGHPSDATHYIDHSAAHHRCVRCTPQQEVAS